MCVPQTRIASSPSAPALALAAGKRSVEDGADQLAQRRGEEYRQRPRVGDVQQVAGGGNAQHAGQGPSRVGDAQQCTCSREAGRGSGHPCILLSLSLCLEQDSSQHLPVWLLQVPTLL